MSLDAPSWLIAWLEGVSVWDALLWLAGLAAAVWFIRKKGWRTVLALARGIIQSAEILVAVQGLPEWQTRIEAKVDGIHHETHKNDGSSVKDAVDRIEVGVEGLHGRMDVVEADVRVLRVADDELRAEIENTHNPNEH